MYAQLRLPARGTRALAQRRVTPPPVAAGAASATINAPPRKSFVRRLVFWTTFGALVFYPTSALISTHNEKYRDLFVQVPGGEFLADYADENGWENFGPGTLAQMVTKLSSTSKDDIQAKLEQAKRAAEAKAHEAAALARSSAADAQKRMHDAAEAARTKAGELTKQASGAAHDIREKAEKAAAEAKEKAERASHVVAESAKEAAQATKGVGKAIVQDTKEVAEVAADKAKEVAKDAERVTQDAVSTHRFPDTAKPRPLRPETVQPQTRSYEGQEQYPEKLPIGFEPPPGFYVPPPPPKPKSEEGKLPLLAPKVKDFGVEEPIIGQLASTIDSLTTTLAGAKGAPSAQAADILGKAQADLSALNARLDDVKKTEQARLQSTVDAKTREFEAQLARKEQEWLAGEDKLKTTWEAERQKMVDGWRDVLDAELAAQRQHIEARLRDEVVSQGIELQRRWLRSIKSQVETERGGRLAKLDALTTSLKQLERITLDNSAVLDDNVKLHKIWSALRAVQAKAERGNVAFDDEVRVLRALSTPTDPDGADTDSVMRAALAHLDASGIPSTGVKSFSDLAAWFAASVAPRIHEAALVPAPEDATVASHLASAVLSKILFRPKAGLVAGTDVGAVLARAEYALGEKDLDAAAREVNSLTGWPRKLAEDWLREARRKLEVQQALDVFATEATLSSLLMV
ncbi:hypothetical protein CC85DRAFT_309652 [Cutaneotrichosporon oleaginosum]|uniref:MICOS complex subunit MIC60 n=1 Tax=Cutaneotrichosporon oleaginosum TaxID=879819 RepID=A0A0J0XD36_9TREE|nr:uncharacterized protein CC85DRAFT_309652 [Cutaneotrichosporon oleaginosum]KLT38985.1 hypothetical protein CC85DRAFT_309652 [Cutaneotrichosporon oleaginosum]TXT14661.1 hypothetical protein COLE_00854 [Cutaneotrichosporon oleaginosum]